MYIDPGKLDLLDVEEALREHGKAKVLQSTMVLETENVCCVEGMDRFCVCSSTSFYQREQAT